MEEGVTRNQKLFKKDPKKKRQAPHIAFQKHRLSLPQKEPLRVSTVLLMSTILRKEVLLSLQPIFLNTRHNMLLNRLLSKNSKSKVKSQI